MSVRYLTVQDLLWVNFQVTQKVLEFQWTTLEEATFDQYGLGQSTDVVGQASRFLRGFARHAPFPFGNEATAFVGVAAFLRMNGYRLTVSDADGPTWLAGFLTGSGSLDAVVTADFQDEIEHVDERSVQEVALQVLARYPSTVRTLATPPFSTEPVAAGFQGQEIWTGPGNVRDYLG